MVCTGAPDRGRPISPFQYIRRHSKLHELLQSLGIDSLRLHVGLPRASRPVPRRLAVLVAELDVLATEDGPVSALHHLQRAMRRRNRANKAQTRLLAQPLHSSHLPRRPGVVCQHCLHGIRQRPKRGVPKLLPCRPQSCLSRNVASSQLFHRNLPPYRRAERRAWQVVTSARMAGIRVEIAQSFLRLATG